jgi:hypothetical protein
MEKISCDRVKEEVLYGSRVEGREGGREGGRKKGRKIVRKIKRRKSNWIGYTLRMNCLLKHVIEIKKRREAKKKA